MSAIVVTVRFANGSGVRWRRLWKNRTPFLHAKVKAAPSWSEVGEETGYCQDDRLHVGADDEQNSSLVNLPYVCYDSQSSYESVVDVAHRDVISHPKWC